MEHRLRLSQWFEQESGARLLQDEHRLFDRLLAGGSGRYAVQIGLPQVNMLGASLIRSKFVLGLDTHIAADSSLICKEEALPFASESIDLIVLLHVLEFVSDPQEMLREIARVLAGEGRLLIAGFNLYSLWGLCNALWSWQMRAPWTGRFLSVDRVRNWLLLLGLCPLTGYGLRIFPPCRSFCFWRRALPAPLDRCAGVYVLEVQKSLLPLNLVRPWKRRPDVLESGLCGIASS